ncbi:MAG: transposase [Planctomycetaceae bacterium]
MDYHFFTPEVPTTVSRGRLPHWEQPHACYFITFRTADSLPRQTCLELSARRATWLREHGIATSDTRDADSLARLSPQDRTEFTRQCARAWHDSLDACHGACVLRTPSLRQHVVDALRYGDGTQYDLDAFVVMPNHVHVLAGFAAAGTMRQQCSSWKRYAATRIHRDLGLRGRFWQAESYDRVLRNLRGLEAWRLYIADNPRKAGLRDDEYVVYLRPEPIVGSEQARTPPAE